MQSGRRNVSPTPPLLSISLRFLVVASAVAAIPAISRTLRARSAICVGRSEDPPSLPPPPPPPPPPSSMNLRLREERRWERGDRTPRNWSISPRFSGDEDQGPRAPAVLPPLSLSLSLFGLRARARAREPRFIPRRKYTDRPSELARNILTMADGVSFSRRLCRRGRTYCRSPLTGEARRGGRGTIRKVRNDPPESRAVTFSD